MCGSIARAETLTIKNTHSDGASSYLLKRIVENLGNRLRALIVEPNGHERRIILTADDVIEIKRGLWVVRPGVYQTDI